MACAASHVPSHPQWIWFSPYSLQDAGSDVGTSQQSGNGSGFGGDLGSSDDAGDNVVLQHIAQQLLVAQQSLSSHVQGSQGGSEGLVGGGEQSDGGVRVGGSGQDGGAGADGSHQGGQVGHGGGDGGDGGTRDDGGRDQDLQGKQKNNAMSRHVTSINSRGNCLTTSAATSIDASY